MSGPSDMSDSVLASPSDPVTNKADTVLARLELAFWEVRVRVSVSSFI